MLTISNLSKSFGSRKILDTLNVYLEEARIYSLVGGNGAGKTTLFNIINGYLKPEKGSIALKNNLLINKKPYQLNRLGIGRTFQDLRLISKLSVEENIHLAINNNPNNIWYNALFNLGNSYTRKKNSESVDKILRQFYLLDIRFNKVNNISYGQQKLLALACCVINDAQLLLLDEPISGIQPLYREHIATILKELRNSGKTVFLIEHSPPFLEEVSDEFLFLNNGKISNFDNYQQLRTDKIVLESYLS